MKVGKSRVIDWLTVDTGENIGWALWNRHTLEKYGCINHPNAKAAWPDKIDYIGAQFGRFLDEHYIDRVYIEFPEHFDGGVGAIATRQGDIIKLSTAAGVVWGLCVSKSIKCMPVRVREWKGQLSKRQVSDRITSVLHLEFPNHVADAVGMGLYLTGKAFR